MKILVIGSGAREHAIVGKFATSPKVSMVYVSPGNPGMKNVATLVQLQDFEKIKDFCISNSIDFVFVGPEQPLSDGLVDYLDSFSISVVGPNKRAAQIESSKAFAKDLMKKYKIPTADYEVFDSYENAHIYLKQSTYPLVIKADGLAAGKGVTIAYDFKEAESCLRKIFIDKTFGDAGNNVVIEEFLRGWECSVFAFCDGDSFVSTIYSQDHKPLLDNDKGPNTGGMGAWAPVPVSEGYREKVEAEIFHKVLSGMKKEGIVYRGILYAGLMITESGPKVIEFNCRFGDPETQVVLPLLKNDLTDICKAILDKKIGEVKLEWKDEYAVGVILASGGYPFDYLKKQPITINYDKLTKQKIKIYFAGLAEENDTFITSGGRVLTVVAEDSSIQSAITKVYENIDEINFNGKFYRKDIGKKGLPAD